MSAVVDYKEALAFSSVVNKHIGKKFLVCGTGPSIDRFPKSFYEEWEGITIGVNKITELFTPNYHIDIHARPNIIRDNIEGLDLIFKYFGHSAQIDPEKSGLLSMVGTVAVTALTAAYQLGASDIYLIGIDLKITPEQHHFKGCTTLYWDEDNPLPSPLPSDFDSTIANTVHLFRDENQLGATLRCFDRAIRLYREQGIKIINLSQDSLLEV